LHALFTVIGVTDSRSSADNAPAFITSVVALVANFDQRARSYIGVADYALTVAFLAHRANRNARLLTTHYQVWVVFSHIKLIINISVEYL
jgi:hypothetical protein